MSNLKTHPWIYIEDGDANKYHIVQGGKWVLALLHNGEQATETQRLNMNRIVLCVNALHGVPEEDMGLLTRIIQYADWEEHSAYVRKLESAKDELLSALELIQTTLSGETSSEKQTLAYAFADGALSKFKEEKP